MANNAKYLIDDEADEDDDSENEVGAARKEDAYYDKDFLKRKNERLDLAQLEARY